MTTFAAISDTHNKHGQAQAVMPKADILIHAGDACGYGNQTELEIFAMWLDMLPYKHKIYVAGNHDKFLQEHPREARDILRQVRGLTYLEDQGCEIEGIKFYGSPCMPPLRHWAWGCDENKRRAIWSRIPKDTNILVTHCPPLGVGDLTLQNTRIGCPYLRDVVDRIAPKFHVFGHNHEGAGVGNNGRTHFINAAFLNRKYDPQNKPTLWIA